MNSSPSIRHCRARQAFSLMELMCVIALMAIMALLVAPSLKSILAGVEVSSAATTLNDSLNLARQTALGSNRPVEVRFYTITPPAGAPDQTPYPAIGLYRIDDDGPRLIRRLIYLEKRVRLATDATFAPLLFNASSGSAKLTAVDPTGAISYDYRYFQFRPDGSTTLASEPSGAPGETWHVMIYQTTQPPTGTTPPKNYATVQLDPVTGRTKIFRPGT